jgi:uncharacterized lipoprotein YddW (UPF0748 family)
MQARALSAIGLMIALAASSVAADRPPTVVVITGDLLGGGGPDVARLSRERGDAVTAALEKAGIPYQVTSDSLVAKSGLPNVPVAILPYNRAISDDEFYHLRAYLDRPAHLIVFFTCRDDLAAALGAQLGSVTRELFAGQFYAIGCETGSIVGVPARTICDAQHIRELTPLAGARSLGVWQTPAGTPGTFAGVSLSARGALVSCPPSAQHPRDLARLLRSLVGHFAPELWRALCPDDPAAVGRIGPYGSLRQFKSALDKATGNHLGNARADVDEALALFASVAGRLAVGDQDGAIAASRRARILGHRSWFRSYPSYDPEIRGVWAGDKMPGGWEDAMRRLGAANFNCVFPYFASGAAAYYPSRVLPAATTIGSENPVTESVRWGNKYGVEVHARILGFFTMGASAATRDELQRQGRLARKPNGYDRNWLCPSNHQNRAQIVQTALELADYGVDAIQFDYLRYSWKDQCVCDTCRARFEADTGVRVANWPADVLRGKHKQRWLSWRREQITSLLRTVRSKLAEQAPGVGLNAAVFVNWEGHRDTFGQDWQRWIDEGLVDFVCPMDYFPDLDEFAGWVRKQEAWADGKCPVAAGLGPFADNVAMTPQQVLDQVQAARRLGCEGFVVFNYTQSFADDYLPLMALGATSRPAAMPTEARVQH